MKFVLFSALTLFVASTSLATERDFYHFQRIRERANLNREFHERQKANLNESQQHQESVKKSHEDELSQN